MAWCLHNACKQLLNATVWLNGMALLMVWWQLKNGMVLLNGVALYNSTGALQWCGTLHKHST